MQGAREAAEQAQTGDGARREVAHQLPETSGFERLVPPPRRDEVAQLGQVTERPAPAVSAVGREAVEHRERDGFTFGREILDGARELRNVAEPGARRQEPGHEGDRDSTS